MGKLLLAVIGAFLLSCSTFNLEAKREFVDNTFSAVNPNFSVKLSDTFEQYDRLKENDFSFFTYGSGSGTTTNIETHIFVDRFRQREFTVIIKRLNSGYWLPDLNQGLPNVLESGKMIKGGDQYYYALYSYKSSDDANLLIKRAARCYGADNKTLISYYYISPIESNLGDIDQWQDPKALDADQQSFLAQFKKDFEEDITFME